MNIELLRFLDSRGVRLSFTALQRMPSDIVIYEPLRVLELSVMARYKATPIHHNAFVVLVLLIRYMYFL